MNWRLVTIVLGILALGLLAALVPKLLALRLPGDHSGFEPEQPIAYSHRLHAGELQIPCLYCHFGAEKSRHAGIPAASTCMNCHKFITAPRTEMRAEEELAKKEGREPTRIISKEMKKLYDAVGLDANLARVEGAGHPIAWVRIHKLPDFAYFDHRPHVASGLECQKCHGPIETMERVRQVESLNMGWCVNCHRGRDGTALAGKPVNASADCSACHH